MTSTVSVLANQSLNGTLTLGSSSAYSDAELVLLGVAMAVLVLAIVFGT